MSLEPQPASPRIPTPITNANVDAFFMNVTPQ